MPTTRLYPFRHSDGGRAEEGFVSESRDCVVRALAVAFDRPYAEMHALAQTRFGRKHHGGVWPHRYFPYLDENAQRLEIKRPRPTIRTFLLQHPTGDFFVRISEHALAIKNGVLVDLTKMSDLCRVTDAWQILGKTK